MRGERHKASRRTAKSGAFTLVELLVIISIIGLLVTILMPTLGKAKDLARKAKTEALLKTLENGLTMFTAETKLGDEYPPSSWPGANPPVLGGQAAYGAHTLVWAVAGYDLRGTVGFPTTGLSMAALYDPNISKARYGPYVDLGQLGVGMPSQADFSDDNCRNYRTVMDAFGMPVLYFRANPRMKLTTATAVYTKTDNDPFLSPDLGTNFNTRIQDTRVPSGYAPLNPDKYLLISAGIDKKFGYVLDTDTNDDIGNYTK